MKPSNQCARQALIMLPPDAISPAVLLKAFPPRSRVGISGQKAIFYRRLPSASTACNSQIRTPVRIHISRPIRNPITPTNIQLPFHASRITSRRRTPYPTYSHPFPPNDTFFSLRLVRCP
jgi:hypothetical protein